MAYKGINFRASSGYVSDGTDETYSLGEAYPTTRGGLTFGWSSDRTGNSRDRANTNDRRLAGIVFSSNTTPTDFKIDLPSTGSAVIRLSLGDAGSNQINRVQLLDNTTVFATLSGDTIPQNFIDASGATLSSTTWPGSNASITHNFTSTTFIVRVGDGIASANGSITHVSFDISSGETAAISTTNPVETVSMAMSVAGAVTTAISTTNPAETVSMTVATTAGTLTTRKFGPNTGSYYPAGTVCDALNIYDAATGALVLRVTGQALNGSSRLVVTNGAMAIGGTYAYEAVFTTTGFGRRLPIGTCS